MDTTCTRYKIEIGPDKTKKTNNINGFQREIKIKGKRLDRRGEEIQISGINLNGGSKPKILSRIAQTTDLYMLFLKGNL